MTSHWLFLSWIVVTFLMTVSVLRINIVSMCVFILLRCGFLFALYTMQQQLVLTKRDQSAAVSYSSTRG